jgi:hypothetical protein
MQTISRKLRRSVLLGLGAATLAGTVALTACGTPGGPAESGSTVGSGGSGTGGGGHGGHGGAPVMACPSIPPSNLDSCAGFSLGDQCNYGSSSSGTLSSTECQCDGLAGGSLAWSCGTEAVGTGPASSSSSSSG